MKPILLSILLIVGLGFTLPTLTGCKTDSVQTIAFKSLKSVAQAAETARKTYNIARKQGKITFEKEAEMLGLWDKYQKAEFAAVKAARLDFDSPATSDVQAAAIAFINAANALK